jgi:hypothetical protein
LVGSLGRDGGERPQGRGVDGNVDPLAVVRLEGAAKHGGEHDLAELRQKLEQMLSHRLPDEELANALEMPDEHLPGQRYGEAEDEEGEEHRGQTKMRRFLEDCGVADEDIEELSSLSGWAAIVTRCRATSATSSRAGLGAIPRLRRRN